ncbi:MAG: hypothetical protein JNL01_10205 [Bdellovibrionales bacterium]|nr:hypothetical protein [Bdellovibrionales bacterium]
MKRKRLGLRLVVAILALTPFSKAWAKKVGNCAEHDRFRAVYCADLAVSHLGSSNPKLKAAAQKCSKDQSCWCRLNVVGPGGSAVLQNLDPPNGEIASRPGPGFVKNPKGHLAPKVAEFQWIRDQYIGDPTFLQVAKYDIDRNRDCTIPRHRKGECHLDVVNLEKRGKKFQIASVCDQSGNHFNEDFYIAGVDETIKIKTAGKPSSHPKRISRNPGSSKSVAGGYTGVYGSITVGVVSGAGAIMLVGLSNGEGGLMLAGGVGAVAGAALSACAGAVAGIISGPGCHGLSDLEGWGITACGGASVKAIAGAGAGVCVSAGLRNAPKFKGKDARMLGEALALSLTQLMSGRAPANLNQVSSASKEVLSNINPCFAYGPFGEVCAGVGGGVGAVGIGKTTTLKRFKKGSIQEFGFRMMLGLPLR